MTRLALLACVLGFACKRSEPAAEKTAAQPSQETACAKAEAKGPIAWIEDDYPAALACAREKKVPLVLDLWAPWCHTCLSMQTTVFVDPAMATDATKFVFAAIDTDREVNAEVVGKFAPSAWPTFYVIGNDEQVLARFIGAANVTQFRDFMASGAKAAAGGGAAADARLLGGQRALAKKDFATADEELSAALAATSRAWPRRDELLNALIMVKLRRGHSMPEKWPRRDELLNALIMVKLRRGDAKACIDLGDKYMDTAGENALATNFISMAVDCAGNAKDDPRAAALRDKGIARWKAILANAAAPLSVDDRAEAMGYLRDALESAGKADDAKKVAEQSRALIDDAYAKATTPLGKMTYIWPRAEVYAWLGRPLDLVADYEALAKQLPDEYDPPARLGWLFLTAGKLDDAATWTERALGLVYGPRKARLLAQRAEIAKAAGDKATERSYREQVVKLWESLPPAQQNPDSLEAAKKAVAALDAPATGSATAKH
jgi:tetratricopeptide (TPR) repeat protein